MYASVDDFIKRIGELEAVQLTDRELSGEVDRELLEVALGDASSQIDGYLSGRYRLPLMSTPPNLIRICCDIARYHLTSKSGVTTMDAIENRYKLCLRELENIAKGVVSLGVDEITEMLSGEGENSVQFLGGDNRIWGRTRR